ncbi:sigma 54 modulation/S30EA ribosomal C-terminal domain-containing protein [Amycolatopsis sacchari]|uniref:sigma 54 modulation/S30EA ribosomal C-terminal domain-containing protein n=1 Tax=Amycolatopsis sacchari TaxID=115433 RepID=UPI0011785D2B|nr:sigma 54 modulation/S30EA ribosomal C-terminal domain-containing protein [Amycolatopsis sacchari]
MNDNGIPLGSIEISVRGQLPGAGEHLRRRLHDALARAPRPVLAARATIARRNDAAAAVRISATIDLNGRILHVDVDGETVATAVDHLQDCVRRALDRAGRHRAAADRHRPARPVAVRDREIVRHRTFSLAPVAVAVAAEELQALGYEFHLFTDAGTGQDCVLYRVPGGLRLAGLDPAVQGGPATVSPHPAPRLTLDEARERFELDDRPFLFFAEAGTGRGALLHRRHDGDLGLVTAG